MCDLRRELHFRRIKRRSRGLRKANFVLIFCGMRIIVFVVVSSFLSVTYGQTCRGRFNQQITGQCSSIDSCEGTILASDSCEQNRCCVNETAPVAPSTCITEDDFDVLYNTSRATFLREVLNYGIHSAGICNNCQAKAAFLAVAATLTQDFQTDEAMGTDAQFAQDDTKYRNTHVGDGSRFRRRGFFGLRGREMYGRLQVLKPHYLNMTDPEVAALTGSSIDIASLIWNNPELQGGKFGKVKFKFYVRYY